MFWYFIGYTAVFFAAIGFIVSFSESNDFSIGYICLLIFCIYLLVFPWLTIDDKQIDKISEIYNKPEYSECKIFVDSKTVNNYQYTAYFKCIEKINEVNKFREMRDGTDKNLKE